MKPIKAVFLFSYAILFVLLSGCEGLTQKGSKAEKRTSTVFAMDTVMEITAYGDEENLKEAEKLIRDLERKFSVTLEESDIYELNSKKSARVSGETLELIKMSEALCERTDGVLDITIYPVVKAWGFTTENYRVPTDGELSELLKYVDHKKVVIEGDTVTLPENMMVDLGSVAKGYTGDKVLELFKNAGVTSALINLGGNVQALGAKHDGSFWKVAISDPEKKSEYAGVVSIA